MKYTGSATTTALTFNGIATPNLIKVIIRNLVLDGNGLATNGVLLTSVSFPDIEEIRVTNVSGKGITCAWCVGGVISQPTVSVNVESFTTTPTNGLWLTDVAGSKTSALTVISPRIEGVTGSGIVCENADGVMFRGGTSEGNGLGWDGRSACNQVKVDALWLEGNTTQLTHAGNNGRFTGVVSSGSATSTLTSTASVNIIEGGVWNAITVSSGGIQNTIKDVQVATSITNNETTTTLLNNFSSISGKLADLTHGAEDLEILDASTSDLAIGLTVGRYGAAATGTRGIGLVFKDASGVTLTGGVAATRINAAGNYLASVGLYANIGGPATSFADLTSLWTCNNTGCSGIGVTVGTLGTNTNCSSSASPAVCGVSAAGSVVVAAAATTVVVNTTAVTANSQIMLTFDSSLGTKLGVTCNTTQPTAFNVSARTAATNFTITATAPTTNPACYSYSIIN